MSLGRALLLLQRVNAPLTRPTRPNREVPESEPNPFGIRDADYRLWRAGRSLNYVPLAYISREEALQCVHDAYWLPAQCHRLAWPIAVATLACALHTGVPSAQRMLRQALLMTVMGPTLGAQAAREAQAQQPGRFEWPLSAEELAAIDAQPVLPFLAAVLEARRAWLTEIAERDASQAEPCEGWVASINALALALGAAPPQADRSTKPAPALMAALAAT